MLALRVSCLRLATRRVGGDSSGRWACACCFRRSRCSWPVKSCRGDSGCSDTGRPTRFLHTTSSKRATCTTCSSRSSARASWWRGSPWCGALWGRLWRGWVMRPRGFAPHLPPWLSSPQLQLWSSSTRSSCRGRSLSCCSAWLLWAMPWRAGPVPRRWFVAACCGLASRSPHRSPGSSTRSRSRPRPSWRGLKPCCSASPSLSAPTA